MKNQAPLGEIILITKLETQNQGNQALSIAWRDRLESLFPRHVIRPIERSPNYLKRFTVGYFTSKADPVVAFEKIVGDLCRRARKIQVEAPPIRRDIRHNSKISQAIRAVRLRRLLNVRSRLSALGLGRRNYLNRLALFRQSKMLVMNPAGEFYPAAADTALAYLIELRCAQVLGIPTAMVNLSFEVMDKTLRLLSAHVLDQCSVLQFRDTESLEEYRSAGGRQSPVVLPDGALMTRPPAAAEESDHGGIALAINALQVRAAGLQLPWAEFIDQLVAQDLKPVLTSNEWTTDEPFWGQFTADGRIKAVGREADYQEYMQLLRNFDVVISSRLHTCVLSIVAGVPVVPVETGTFKLTGFFRQAGLPLPIRLGSRGWQQAIVESVRAIQADRSKAVDVQNRQRDIALDRLNRGIEAMFGQVLVKR